MKTVIESTVKRGFCIGCGVCAGICPKKSLVMQWNEYGEYNPSLVLGCISCGLCIKVCPFADGNDNEDVIGKRLFEEIPDMHHRMETGYYISCGVGAVACEKARMQSSSGGLATWFLEQLLIRNIVDAVICVEHSEDGKRLFKYHPAFTPEEIRASRGSAYYPVEISDMLAYIAEHPARYAVIALPCMAKALRLAQQKSKTIRENIIVIVGLICCNMKNAHFTKYNAYKQGLSAELICASYRHKSLAFPANFYEFRFKDIYGTVATKKWDAKIWKQYVSWFCTIHACDCCDDMFAECADISFMDAWLPEYSTNPLGTSLWISRSPFVNDIMQYGTNSAEIYGKSLAVDKIIESQTSTRYKKELLKYRLLIMERGGEHPPVKRVSAGWGNSNNMEREDCRYRMRIQKESREMCLSGYEALDKWFAMASCNRPKLIQIQRLIFTGFDYLVKRVR